MNAFRLNPMLVENLALVQNYLNGFEIKCLSESTDVSQLIQKQLHQLVKHCEEEQMCFSNLRIETEVTGFNTVQFLIGAEEMYDLSDEERALTWLPTIKEALTKARAFAP